MRKLWLAICNLTLVQLKPYIAILITIGLAMIILLQINFVRRYFKAEECQRLPFPNVEFKDQLKYLLKDIEELGYRSLNSWRIEIAGMLIILHSGSKSKCRKVLQKIKDLFGEKVYKNALAFARRNNYDGAKNWFNDITVVDRICARARVQTASVYKLAVA